MAPASLFSPAPYHILSYGTLLGVTMFHSFVNHFVLPDALPFPQGIRVMKRFFPLYFWWQTVLPFLMLLTYPSTHPDVWGGWEALSDWQVLIPLIGMSSTGAMNLLFIFPESMRVFEESKALLKESIEEGDKLKGEIAGGKLKTYTELEAVGGFLNFWTFVGAVVYGFTLGSRL